MKLYILSLLHSQMSNLIYGTELSDHIEISSQALESDWTIRAVWCVGKRQTLLEKHSTILCVSYPLA